MKLCKTCRSNCKDEEVTECPFYEKQTRTIYNFGDLMDDRRPQYPPSTIVLSTEDHRRLTNEMGTQRGGVYNIYGMRIVVDDNLTAGSSYIAHRDPRDYTRLFQIGSPTYDDIIDAIAIMREQGYDPTFLQGATPDPYNNPEYQREAQQAYEEPLMRARVEAVEQVMEESRQREEQEREGEYWATQGLGSGSAESFAEGNP